MDSDYNDKYYGKTPNKSPNTDADYSYISQQILLKNAGTVCSRLMTYLPNKEGTKPSGDRWIDLNKSNESNAGLHSCALPYIEPTT